MCVHVRAHVCLHCKRIHAFQPGQTWSQIGNACELFTCIKNNNTLETKTSHFVCPPFEESNCEPVSVIFHTFLCWNDRNLECVEEKNKFFVLSLFSEHNSD